MRPSMTQKAASLCLALCLTAGYASALSLTINRVAGHYSGNAGEFTIFGTGFEANYASDATASIGGVLGFQSFCLEIDEFVTSGASYDATIDTEAIMGGAGGGSPDPLGRGTAWLYQQFATGQLEGYNYAVGSGRVNSARLLQDAIYYLEDEITAIPSANPFLSLVELQYGSLALAKETASLSELNQLGVRVLNLTANGVHHQSQLVYVGVPDGGLTLGMLGIALAGLGGMRRRSRK